MKMMIVIKTLAITTIVVVIIIIITIRAIMKCVKGPFSDVHCCA